MHARIVSAFLHVILVHEKNGPRAILTAFVKRMALKGSFLLVHTPARMALGPLLFFLNIQLRMDLGLFLFVNTDTTKFKH